MRWQAAFESAGMVLRRTSSVTGAVASVCPALHTTQRMGRTGARHALSRIDDVCIPEQRRQAALATLRIVQLNSMKALVGAVWVTVVCLAGIAFGVRSLSGWAMLAVVAVLPALVVVMRWKSPPPTMSESIREVLK